MPSGTPRDSQRIQVGKIAQSHGVRGLVKLLIIATDHTILNDATLYTGESSNDTIKLKLKNSLGKYWLAEIEGIHDRNASDELRHTQLWIDKSALPDTDDDEFYYDDLTGLNVFDVDNNNKKIGHVLGVSNFGASDLLEIKPPSGESFYLPFTDECVPDIDLENESVFVSIPAGLLDEKEQDDE